LNTFEVPSNRCDRQIDGIRIWSRSGPGVQRSGLTHLNKHNSYFNTIHILDLSSRIEWGGHVGEPPGCNACCQKRPLGPNPAETDYCLYISTSTWIAATEAPATDSINFLSGTVAGGRKRYLYLLYFSNSFSSFFRGSMYISWCFFTKSSIFLKISGKASLLGMYS